MEAKQQGTVRYTTPEKLHQEPSAMQERCSLCNVTSGVSYYHQANTADRVSLNIPPKA